MPSSRCPVPYNEFKSKISCSSIFDSLSIRILARIIRDYSTFVVNHDFKARSRLDMFLLPLIFARTLKFLSKIIFRLQTFCNIAYTSIFF
jgi:hypothetical protein